LDEAGLTSRDTLHTATTSETTDSRLCDTLDVVAKNLAVTLGAALAETLATFAAYRGCVSMMLMCLVYEEARDNDVT